MESLHRAFRVVDQRRTALNRQLPGRASRLRGVRDIAAALDHIECELRAELPAHMRAFARAHSEGRLPPAAPLVARMESTLDTALAACAIEDLFERGLALLRLAAPIAIEADPVVVSARRQTPSWAGLAELSRARDAAARARFGIDSIAVLHTLHGTLERYPEHDCNEVELGSGVDGWHTPSALCDATAVQDVWTALATRLGVTGAVRIDRADGARPRTFVIEPRREVIVVVAAAIETPAARFELLHELGHAVAALVLEPGVPRVIDEAVAAYVSRLMESPSWLPPRWTSDVASSARQRRTAIAGMLDRIERELPTVPLTAGWQPPWALWHDPGAAASYIAAEVIADRLVRDLGPNPPRGQFARAVAAERDHIDRRTNV